MTNNFGSKSIPMRACANIAMFDAHLTFVVNQGLTPYMSVSPMMTLREFEGFPPGFLDAYKTKGEDGYYDSLILNLSGKACNALYSVPENGMLILEIAIGGKRCRVSIPIEAVIEVRSLETPIVSLTRMGWKLNTMKRGLSVVTHDGKDHVVEKFVGDELATFNVPARNEASEADKAVYAGIAARYFDETNAVVPAEQTLEDADMTNVVRGAFGKPRK